MISTATFDAMQLHLLILLPCYAASRYHLRDDRAGRGYNFNMMSLWIAQASAAAATPSAGSGDGWLIDPEVVDPGYGQTMAGGEIQTAFPAPPPPTERPRWDLGWLRDFFEWTAPALKPLLWIGAAEIH